MGEADRVVARVLITDGQELAALGAARSLGRAGHRVRVVYSSASAPPSAASRFVAEAQRGPDPWREQPAFRDFLRDLARRDPDDVILPISEAAVVAVAAQRRELPGHLILPGEEQLRFTLSKYHATAAAMSAGIDVPPTAFLLEPRLDGDPDPGPIATDAELLQRVAALGLPLLFKTDNHFLADGRYQKGRVAMVRTPLEAAAILAEARSVGAGLIAQRPIPGHGEGVFLLRHGGKVLLRFAHRRLHEVPYTGGVSSLRCSLYDEALIAQAERLLAAIDYEGVAMLEFRRAPFDEAYFLEINGRLWGSLALALHAGVDFPAALIDCALTGTSSRQQRLFGDGLRCRNLLSGEIEHVASILRADRETVPLRRKLGAIGEFALLSIDPRVRHDHLWPGDPLPALVQAKRTAVDLAQRLGAKLRRRSAERRDRPLLERVIAAQPELLARIDRADAHASKEVLFLCYGNICRSPFAAEYARAHVPDRVRIRSAGFHSHEGRSTPPRFLPLAMAHGVDLSGHRSRRVRPEDLESASLIVVMDAANLRCLVEEAPSAIEKTLLLGPLLPDRPAEIADPYTLDIGDARRCYEQLAVATEQLARYLAPRS